jgi:hypothetical protein
MAVEALRTLVDDVVMGRKRLIEEELRSIGEDLRAEEEALKRLWASRPLKRGPDGRRKGEESIREEEEKWKSDLRRAEDLVEEKRRAERALAEEWRDLDSAAVGEGSDPEDIQEERRRVEELFRKLDPLTLALDSAIRALPIGMKPLDGRVAGTPKRPVPLAAFIPEPQGEVDEGLLERTVEPFRLKPEDGMSPRGLDLRARALAGKQLLRLTLPFIVRREVFPREERLVPGNIAWTLRALPEIARNGGKLYGYPGLPAF